MDGLCKDKVTQGLTKERSLARFQGTLPGAEDGGREDSEPSVLSPTGELVGQEGVKEQRLTGHIDSTSHDTFSNRQFPHGPHLCQDIDLTPALDCLSSCLQPLGSGDSAPALGCCRHFASSFLFSWGTSTSGSPPVVGLWIPLHSYKVWRTPRKSLLIWAIATDIYHIRNYQQDFKNMYVLIHLKINYTLMYVNKHSIHNVHNIFSKTEKKCFTKKIDLFVFMSHCWYQDAELGFTDLHDFVGTLLKALQTLLFLSI